MVMLKKQYVRVSIVVAVLCGLIITSCAKKEDGPTGKGPTGLIKAELLVELPD